MKRLAETEEDFWAEFIRLSREGVVTPTHGIKFPVLRFSSVGRYVAIDSHGRLYAMQDGTTVYLTPAQTTAVEGDVLLDSLGVVCLTGVFDPRVVLVLHEPKGLSWR